MTRMQKWRRRRRNGLASFLGAADHQEVEESAADRQEAAESAAVLPAAHRSSRRRMRRRRWVPMSAAARQEESNSAAASLEAANIPSTSLVAIPQSNPSSVATAQIPAVTAKSVQSPVVVNKPVQLPVAINKPVHSPAATIQFPAVAAQFPVVTAQSFQSHVVVDKPVQLSVAIDEPVHSPAATVPSPTSPPSLSSLLWLLPDLISNSYLEPFPRPPDIALYLDPLPRPPDPAPFLDPPPRPPDPDPFLKPSSWFPPPSLPWLLLPVPPAFLCLFICCRWQIEGLSWDPVECGSKRISLPREKMWFPDIVINEFMDENRAPETYYVYVTSTGEVIDGMPIHVISSCRLDIYTFPFDIQNCTYTFNSYKHDIQDVQLFFFKPVEDIFKQSLKAMSTEGEWELIDMQGEKPVQIYMEGGWDVLIFHIVLRRRATLYVVNLLIPSCFLLSVDLFSFLLPPQSVDRASFKMTLILGYTVFLLLMNDLLPVTGNTLPLLNVFFSFCMALMVASLLETILITNILCGSSNYPPLPKWIRILVLKYLARLVCQGKKSFDQKSEITVYENSMTKITKKESISAKPLTLREQCLEEMRNMSKDLLAIRHQVEEHFINDNRTDEWILFGQVIDRALFILYFLFITISSITIIVLWAHSFNYDKNY
ncbi:5-hydroxytryptamine receptor 3A-like [Myxocyprinus asiaticus]|uniref:5-hydroxytryptamine receptor 3A-like n=1 Tax=Myxocyprinus asiaticus TaxID=70543 RepID=UPI002222EDD5|nr:5-hydroxytryptamine receptor 3A-like [Myxocyprinus asiaticus]